MKAQLRQILQHQGPGALYQDGSKQGNTILGLRKTNPQKTEWLSSHTHLQRRGPRGVGEKDLVGGQTETASRNLSKATASPPKP